MVIWTTSSNRQLELSSNKWRLYNVSRNPSSALANSTEADQLSDKSAQQIMDLLDTEENARFIKVPRLDLIELED